MASALLLCETAGADEACGYWHKCGVIACSDPVRTGRLFAGPVCPGYAVTKIFGIKMTYFYDEEKLKVFYGEYANTGQAFGTAASSSSRALSSSVCTTNVSSLP